LNVLVLSYPQDPKSPNATRYAAAEMAIDKVQRKFAIDLSVMHRFFEHFSIFVVPNVGRSLMPSATVCSPLPAR
jgi:hypothetical protein